MGLFDKLQNQTAQQDSSAPLPVQEGTFTFSFPELPESLEQMKALNIMF